MRDAIIWTKNSKHANAKKYVLKNIKKWKNEDDEDSDGDENEEACIFCNDLHSNSKDSESWIKWINCKGLAEEVCPKCGEEDDNFICDLCP